MAERQQLVDRLRAMNDPRFVWGEGNRAALTQAADQIQSDQHLRAVVEGLVGATSEFLIAVSHSPDGLDHRCLLTRKELKVALKQAKEALG